MTSKSKREQFGPIKLPIILGVAVIVVLLGLTWRAAQSGWGTLLATYAARTNNLAAANAAAKRSPNNADARYSRATILEASDLREAIAEHSNAVRCRPDDYALWLSLARAYELNGATEAAVATARQATRLAPFYSQPHYQLGNLLARSGRTAEAFVELRRAAESDPRLLPGIIDLAWRLSGGNVQFVNQALAPSTNEARIALATYFRTHDQVDAAIDHYQAAGNDAEQERAYYVEQLITANRFKEAAKLWAVDHPEGVAAAQIRDPGFEKEGDLNEPGFSWRAGQKPEGLRFSLDTSERAEGNSSLRIEFAGSHDAGSPIISQLVIVEPGSQYELRFSVRTENLVGGDLPRFFVLDAASRTSLVQSTDFDRTSNWREYVLPFNTGVQTETVRLLLQRQCATSPCPIFGRLWLDRFSLRKL